MIEPRNKHKMKRKFRVKYQQKRAFREFEEKFDKEIKADEARAAKERKLKWDNKIESFNKKCHFSHFTDANFKIEANFEQ